MEAPTPMPLRLRLIVGYVLIVNLILFLCFLAGGIIVSCCIPGNWISAVYNTEDLRTIEYLDSLMTTLALALLISAAGWLSIWIGISKTFSRKPFGWSLLVGSGVFFNISFLALQQTRPFSVDGIAIQQELDHGSSMRVSKLCTKYKNELSDIQELLCAVNGGERSVMLALIQSGKHSLKDLLFQLIANGVFLWVFFSKKTLRYFGWSTIPQREICFAIILGLLFGLCGGAKNRSFDRRSAP